MSEQYRAPRRLFRACRDFGWAEARAIANAAHKAEADAHTASVAPLIAEVRAAGAKSLRQIAAALNGRGIATARGGKWEAAAVANVLKRVAA